MYFLDFRSDPDAFFSQGRSRIRIHITAYNILAINLVKGVEYKSTGIKNAKNCSICNKNKLITTDVIMSDGRRDLKKKSV